jgi:hypothetical protein
METTQAQFAYRAARFAPKSLDFSAIDRARSIKSLAGALTTAASANTLGRARPAPVAAAKTDTWLAL